MLYGIIALVALNILLTILIFTKRNDQRIDISPQLSEQRVEITSTLAANQQLLNESIKSLTESISKNAREDREANETWRTNSQRSLEQKVTLVQETLKKELETLRQGNEQKLEQMRMTVDEKLQGTLEQRLGESFKLVSERLEAVQKGLGEMQTLATGVGDLKKVLTNVKSRGGWGEAQLGALLEDFLTPNQYVKNYNVKKSTQELVEYAVKMPGRFDDDEVYLPIDSKFPMDKYEQLVAAQETGGDVEGAAKELERSLRNEAKTISDKYIDPPHTTDFAIMFLPTEGLYAEVIRRPGLQQELQQQLRVVITGPSTLTAFLHSLKMGFHTLTIEKRSSEVWKILAKAKEEFRKYGNELDRLKKQLQTAQNTVESVGTRSRAIERSLRDVSTDEIETGDDPLELEMGIEEEI